MRKISGLFFIFSLCLSIPDCLSGSHQKYLIADFVFKDHHAISQASSWNDYCSKAEETLLEYDICGKISHNIRKIHTIQNEMIALLDEHPNVSHKHIKIKQTALRKQMKKLTQTDRETIITTALVWHVEAIDNMVDERDDTSLTKYAWSDVFEKAMITTLLSDQIPENIGSEYVEMDKPFKSLTFIERQFLKIIAKRNVVSFPALFATELSARLLDEELLANQLEQYDNERINRKSELEQFAAELDNEMKASDQLQRDENSKKEARDQQQEQRAKEASLVIRFAATAAVLKCNLL